MKKFNILFVTLLMFVSFQVTFAQDKEFKPEVKIGGTLFTGWQYNVDDADFINRVDLGSPSSTEPFGYSPSKNQFETSKNSFYLERAYINVNASLTPEIKARFTPDIYQATDNAGKTQYFYQVKFAYVEYTPLKIDNGSSLAFQAGVIPNLWVPQIEKAFGYRGMIKTFTDYTFTTSARVTSPAGAVSRSTSSFFSTADLGASVKYTFPRGYGDLSLSVLNGNGFRDLGFDNRFKDIFIAGFVNPIAGQLREKMEAARTLNKNRIDGVSDFSLGAYAYIGKQTNGEYAIANGGQYQNNKFGGMFNFKYNFVNSGFVKLTGELGYESFQVPNTVTNDSTYKSIGFAGYLEFCPPIMELKERLSLVGVFYNFSPDNSADYSPVNAFGGNNAKQSVFGIGLYYKPASILKLGLNYQMSHFDNNVIVKYDGTSTNNLSRMFVNAILDF
ncbi:MAG TPA: hypothetical protein PK447_08755 [Ignavibacteria bacterium]|nr:hypothetical protein [Ignavibacteria bacterium]